MNDIKMNNTCNSCDYTERLAQFKIGKDLVYGKHVIESYKYYDLINNGEVDENKVSYLYSLFLYNLKILTDAGIFKINWLKPHEMVYATKGVFWDWTNEEEYAEMLSCVIQNHGFYFPIFTLPKGIPNNQITPPENMKSLYNAYNGNHRIDIAQYIESYGGFDGDTYLTNIFGYHKLLTIEIPEFCEKSCTGFKYTPLVYDINGPVGLPEYQQFDPIRLFHLRYCSDEMKIDILNYEKESWDIPLCNGIDVVDVRDYQFAFRILQEFQNVLEYPLTYYHKKSKGMHNDITTLPISIIDNMKVISKPELWNEFKSSESKSGCPCQIFPICTVDSLVRIKCELQLCCSLCNKVDDCENRCKFYTKSKKDNE